MICRTCLRATARTRITPPSSTTSTRVFSSAPALRNATPISANTATAPTPRQGSPSSHTPPAAISTSAAKKDAASIPEKKAPLVRSSVPAGTPLKGLNFLKDRQDPVALADDEYPDWLWTVLERQEKKGENAVSGDLFSKSKKQRRLAAKRLRKEQLANPGMLIPKVPIYEQTIDLPAGDGTLEGAVQADTARSELTKAMRDKRRAAIKERNFLKAMG